MQKLWTRSFIFASIGNFLLFFAFYQLIPIFPLYLIESFGATKSVVGIVLSSYTLAALLVRPVSGFVLDMFRRKPLYLLSFLMFVLVFVSYPLIHTIALFLFFRVLHGAAFGFVTTAGNSLVVDILPPERRGEGLGYFGVANNMAMVVGPMSGLIVLEKYDFDHVFYMSIITGIVGFIFAMLIKVEKVQIVREKVPLAFDRFFLFKGFQAGLTLLLMGIPYGMFITYLAIYGQELGITSGLGMFFSILAAGLIFSRLFSGKLVDKGKMNQTIQAGIAVTVVGMLMLASLKGLNEISHLATNIVFFVVPLVLGLGYGLVFPAYNTLFVNLAPNNRRATASSTFMTSWDIGIGLGLVFGGRLADTRGGLPMAFLLGAILLVFSLLFYYKIAGPHYLKNKLR
jgi:MFS family permease